MTESLRSRTAATDHTERSAVAGGARQVSRQAGEHRSDFQVLGRIALSAIERSFEEDLGLCA